MPELDVDAYCTLIRERSRLRRKLDRQEMWLDDNHDDPRVGERDQVWINTLAKYEDTCNQIKELEYAYESGEEWPPA